MLFTGPELPIKGIAAGNPHRQLQTKKRMEERNQGRRIPAQLPRIKDPVGFGKEYGIFQQRSRRTSDTRYRTRCRPRYLGRDQPHGRLRQRQSGR